MDQAEMKARTKQFGLRTMRLVDALPTTICGRTAARQLIRSATSVGANYRAACRGRSRAEFAAKIGNVLEEADESAYWLELTMDGGLLPRPSVEPLHREAEELTAIFVATIKSTVRGNPKSEIRNQKCP